MRAGPHAGAVISFREAGKTYRSFPGFGRAVRAVDGVSLDVMPGEVVGIAGPNGAGKSTLLAMLLGFLRPTDGSVTIDGEHPRRWIERHGAAYLPEFVQVPPRWRLDQALRRYAILSGLAPGVIAARVEAVIALLGLEEHRAKRVSALSKGTIQRLGIAQALLADTFRLGVLDEPTHGLDPVWTLRFRDIVTSMRRENRTILIASHVLDELERVCDRVAIIDRGRIQRVVEPRGLAARRVATEFRLSVSAGEDAVRAAFPAAEPAGPGEYLIRAADLEELNAGLRRLIERGGRVAAVTPVRSALEREFREAVGETS